MRGVAGWPVLRHDRDGRERLHAGLAYRQHMGAGSDMLEEADDVGDIIVEPEAAGRQRNVARIRPVGDIDVVIAAAASATVPRSSVAKWPDSGATTSILGLARVDVLGEVQELAEGQVEFGCHRHRDVPVSDPAGDDPEFGPHMRELEPSDEFERRGELGPEALACAPERRVRESRHAAGRDTQRVEHVVVELIELVEHRPSPSAFR